jgi:hypothetical protein
MRELLYDGAFTNEVQHRVAGVVAYCLSRVFYKARDREDVVAYAELIGKGLKAVWDGCFLPRIRQTGFDIQGVCAVLYVNSLGIRFKAIEADGPLGFDLRAAAFLGPGFADPESLVEEVARSWRVFAPLSSHPLKLACDGKSNAPFALTLEGHESATSGEMVTTLLRDMMEGSHGVWGALFLHNMLMVSEQSVARRYDMRPEEVSDICMAIAFHHFYEAWLPRSELRGKELAADEEKEVDALDKAAWHLSQEHPLAYLLVLCDSLAQWARGSEEVDHPHYKRELTDLEKRREIKLARLHFDPHTCKAEVWQHYDKNKGGLGVYECWTKVPMKLLSVTHGRFRLEVTLLDKECTENTHGARLSAGELRA